MSSTCPACGRHHQQDVVNRSTEINQSGSRGFQPGYNDKFGANIISVSAGNNAAAAQRDFANAIQGPMGRNSFEDEKWRSGIGKRNFRGSL